MSSKTKVLFVLTSAKQGWYLPEFAHPYQVLEKHIEVTIASPLGHSVVDPISVRLFKDDAYCQEFFATKKDLWTSTALLSSYAGRASEFDMIFIVGGFGPMWDLATDETSIGLIKDFYEAGKYVVGLCHGAAAFVNVKLSDGSYLLKGHPVTGFSDLEEEQAIATKVAPDGIPFDLQKQLNERSGGLYEKNPEAWQPHVVVATPKLIFGQNPNSAHPLSVKVLEILQGKS
ncbi:hypothetical protein LTR84_010084 [Exophiala bonariae]|uniref:D-lactate dehydratase n=1 Tax=Exophiala bonariae TaxID=1690606 RepID=A0AAV9NLA4_9EURO|nr:hypothetical protein LTR84_010084 [Exophiala bonariae]